MQNQTLGKKGNKTVFKRVLLSIVGRSLITGAARVFLASCLLMGAARAEEARAQAKPATGAVQTLVDPAAVERVKKLLAGEGELTRLAQICPADMPHEKNARDKSVVGKEKAFACAQSIEACAADCREKKDALACFKLGLAFQIAVKDGGDLHERLFALGCALGSPAACTNRAAGLAAQTPQGEQPAQFGGDCLVRSFERSCAEDDAWGCRMTAHAYATGKLGARADEARAEKALRRSCELFPGFEDCKP
jgi:hypothetical protein